MTNEVKSMKLLKGPSLAAYARKKAAEIGIDGKGIKLVKLVCMIQEKEGNRVCFKKEKSCPHTECCWQLSCGAKMG